MHTTGWSRGLEVSGGGRGAVSHAGLVLLRHLADKTGLTGGLSRALATPRFLVRDRGRVMADLACAVADGARVISDFRVMSDQRELFGLVASVPTAWRTLAEIARGGARADRRITAAVNMARRHAWAQAAARHGALPGVRLADRTLAGVTCIRLDATVTFAHSDKELAEANFKGYGHHPLLAVCDNTGGEPLAWMLRRGSAGSNTAADHLQLLDAAIAAVPPRFRRKLMVTCDGAGASHALVKRLDTLAARRGYELTYSVGWPLSEREKAALRLVPEQAWQRRRRQRSNAARILLKVAGSTLIPPLGRGSRWTGRTCPAAAGSSPTSSGRACLSGTAASWQAPGCSLTWDRGSSTCSPCSDRPWPGRGACVQMVAWPAGSWLLPA